MAVIFAIVEIFINDIEMFLVDWMRKRRMYLSKKKENA